MATRTMRGRSPARNYLKKTLLSTISLSAISIMSLSAQAGITAPSSADVGQTFSISWTENHNNYCTSSSYNYRIVETFGGSSTTYNTASKSRNFTKSAPGSYSYAISFRYCWGPASYNYAYTNIGTVVVTINDAGPAEIQYQYDDLGRLIHVIDPVNGDRDYDYDKAGNRTSVSAD